MLGELENMTAIFLINVIMIILYVITDVQEMTVFPVCKPCFHDYANFVELILVNKASIPVIPYINVQLFLHQLLNHIYPQE